MVEDVVEGLCPEPTSFPSPRQAERLGQRRVNVENGIQPNGCARPSAFGWLILKVVGRDRVLEEAGDSVFIYMNTAGRSGSVHDRERTEPVITATRQRRLVG
jgi:hypothetical protein